MNAYAVLIFLSALVIFSYLFDLFAKRTSLPSVLLLLLLGMAMRPMFQRSGINLPDVSLLLPALGSVGLILIVFEGGLDLVYERSKYALIRKAFVSALVLLLVTSAAIAALRVYTTGATLQACVANAIALSVISSAVAIPSVAKLERETREFVVYESSFSDILGIVRFNFVVSNTSYGPWAFGHLALELVGVLVLSAIFSMALLGLMGRITHHVKFFLVLSILVLVYAVGNTFHLSTLVVVLGFGMFLANTAHVPVAWFRKHFLYSGFKGDLDQMYQLSRESAFLLRTFFFVLFGYSMVPDELRNLVMLQRAGLILLITFALRGLFLKGNLRPPLRPLIYVTPSGLISILLLLSLPPELRIIEVGTDLIFAMVLATCTLIAIGVMGIRRSARIRAADAAQ